MPYRHEKFIVAINIIAMLGLPVFGYASFAEKFAEVDVNSALISLGSSIDKSVSFAVALPPRTTHAIANAIDSAAHAVTIAAEDIAENTKAHITNNIQSSTRLLVGQVSHFQSIFNDTISQTHQVLRRSPAMSGAGKHLMLGAKEAIFGGLRELGKVELISREIHETRSLAALSPIASENATSSPDAAIRYAQNAENQPIKIIERIIIKERNTQQAARSTQTNETNPVIRDTYPVLREQDPRINSLITNLADLTTRVDERYGISQGGGSYSNSALFNMIAQSQRIKRLDDITITNATIEGYVTGTTLSNYLPLGGAHSLEV